MSTRCALAMSLVLGACADGARDDVRRPCPEATWDANLPLAIRWTAGGDVELNEHVARRISVESADGSAVEGVPFGFESGLGLCVIGGLARDADFAWTVTASDGATVQEVDPLEPVRPGRWVFHTAAESAFTAPQAVEECIARAESQSLYSEQCAEFDTADSAGGAP